VIRDKLISLIELSEKKLTDHSNKALSASEQRGALI
jgi:hypothetical protein